MPRDQFPDLRLLIEQNTYVDEGACVDGLRRAAKLSVEDRAAIAARASALISTVRHTKRPGLIEVFLNEYGLSTAEGVALMCLAEALLRVPDAPTIDALITDKIAASDWASHRRASASSLVNTATWALLVTGKVLEGAEPDQTYHLRGAINRVGAPVIRAAVKRAMQEMGAQFVLGETIQSALLRSAKGRTKRDTYSYDMLGEAARTEADAQRYFTSYADAISKIAQAAVTKDICQNPGISIKLSALHPRYEEAQHCTVMSYVVPRLRTLVTMAKDAGIALNIDAEEADRLSLSLDVIEAVLQEPSLAGWDGFGVVVQAYGPRAGHVIDWLYALAERLDRKIMVRLVKGAYWDTEIKRAQVSGLEAFPVFTAKHHTDISYISNARKLLDMTDRIYPQFATHNAHTMAAILYMATDTSAFEFQRLHGMGEALHESVKDAAGTRCRVYAPVGAHRDLLAYLVRRLLENGANSSFVNQLFDTEVLAADLGQDPFEVGVMSNLRTGPALFAPERRNSEGWDLAHRPTRHAIDAARQPFAAAQWHAVPLLAGNVGVGQTSAVINPAQITDTVGSVTWSTPEGVADACAAVAPWNASADVRAEILNKAADLYEAHFGELFALLAREAGKTLPDAVSELREAVDFLRYYAVRGAGPDPLGVVACISPWNFPLAIFTGQVAAGLATGNAVLAKPSEKTPLIAYRAVQLLHAAGVPRTALQLLLGSGDVGAALTSDPRVKGVVFTGSTETAQRIHLNIAAHLDSGAPLIAETGGLNAMIVDSTALPEQAVQAIIESAFQSAGQRCSALRCLYVQEDIAEDFTQMLTGAMDAMVAGAPWTYGTDVGPLIDAAARDSIAAYVAAADAEGRVVHRTSVPDYGNFIAPTLIKVAGVAALEREVFGPVLHIATFKVQQIDAVIDDINATDYGLTFGLQSRIDARVAHVSGRVAAGNIYVNRNQIGAIVGSQPFGGEGMSGTGPKAGGEHYLTRFRKHAPSVAGTGWTVADTYARLNTALTTAPHGAPVKTTSLPGPTGESNVMTVLPRGPILCLGPGQGAAQAQVKSVEALGGIAVATEGYIEAEWLTDLPFFGVMWWGEIAPARALSLALSRRTGPILPLITGTPDVGHVCHERHLCVDTTASGGNVQLLNGLA